MAFEPGRAAVIVVADDSEMNRRVLKAIFEAAGFGVVLAEDGQSALAAIDAAAIAAAVIDLRMPGWDGLETLRRIKAAAPQVPVILITGQGDVPTAVEALKAGAYDFVLRPLSNQQLVSLVRRAIEGRALVAEVGRLRLQVNVGLALSQLMGTSAAIQTLVEHVRQVAGSSFTVVIEGESGSGKEVVARAIHQGSDRRRERFVPIDCGAIPETLMEAELFGHEKGAFSGAERRREGHFQFANGGTLFLDEVDHLPLTMQPKLLRVLQDKQVLPLGSSRHINVDVRLIAAANKPLLGQVAAGGFRQDLYYRLAEFVIVVPPLRSRPEDVPLLTRRFVEEAALDLGRPVPEVQDDVVGLLVGYSWPGNVRELRNVVRQAVLRSGERLEMRLIEQLVSSPAKSTAASVWTQQSLKQVADIAVEEAEKAAIISAVRACGGNKTQAARLLRTDFKTLHLKMKRYGLHAGPHLGAGAES